LSLVIQFGKGAKQGEGNDKNAGKINWRQILLKTWKVKKQ